MYIFIPLNTTSTTTQSETYNCILIQVLPHFQYTFIIIKQQLKEKNLKRIFV